MTFRCQVVFLFTTFFSGDAAVSLVSSLHRLFMNHFVSYSHVWGWTTDRIFWIWVYVTAAFSFLLKHLFIYFVFLFLWSSCCLEVGDKLCTQLVSWSFSFCSNSKSNKLFYCNKASIIWIYPSWRRSSNHLVVTAIFYFFCRNYF